MKFDIAQGLTRDEAIAALCTRWVPSRRIESIPVEESCGRILADDCRAQYDLPPHRVSSFDGIAVCSSDFINGVPDTSHWKRGEQFVSADTGDDFPDKFDTIIAIEQVVFDEADCPHFVSDFIFEAGAAVKQAGSTMRKGELLCETQTCITPQIVAILGAGGYAMVPVFQRIKVAYIPTGNELVPVGKIPERGENIESNSLMLRALLQKWGAEMVTYDIIADNQVLLSEAIDEAIATSDLVLINGGSSRGSEDYNSELLQERASWFAHGIKAIPGRPIGMAIINGIPAINVPGPMIATLLASDWLIRALICFYYHQTPPMRVKVSAILDQPIQARSEFEYLARLILEEIDGALHARMVAGNIGLAQNIRLVNGFMAVPSNQAYEVGDIVEVEVLGTRA